MWDLAVRVGIKVAHMLETMEKKLHSMLFPFVIQNYEKYGFELILEENLFQLNIRNSVHFSFYQVISYRSGTTQMWPDRRRMLQNLINEKEGFLRMMPFLLFSPMPPHISLRHNLLQG